MDDQAFKRIIDMVDPREKGYCSINSIYRGEPRSTNPRSWAQSPPDPTCPVTDVFLRPYDPVYPVPLPEAEVELLREDPPGYQGGFTARVPAHLEPAYGGHDENGVLPVLVLVYETLPSA
jgi:hypothetical protein